MEYFEHFVSILRSLALIRAVVVAATVVVVVAVVVAVFAADMT